MLWLCCVLSTMNSYTLLALGLSLSFTFTTLMGADASKPERKGKLHLIDYPSIGSIARLDPRLDTILPLDAKIEKLAEGYDWAEGPIWIRGG